MSPKTEDMLIFSWTIVGGAALVTILVLLFGQPAQAGEWNGDDYRIGAFVSSDHHDDDFEFNEDNWGLYGCYTRYCAGQFENSYSDIEFWKDNGREHFPAETRRSEFLSVDVLQARPWKLVEVTATFGVVNGYKGISSNHEWRPFASVNLRLAFAKIWQIGPVTVYGAEAGWK